MYVHIYICTIYRIAGNLRGNKISNFSVYTIYIFENGLTYKIFALVSFDQTVFLPHLVPHAFGAAHIKKRLCMRLRLGYGECSFYVAHGYHVYKDILTSIRGEELQCQCEADNVAILFPLCDVEPFSAIHDVSIVGHVTYCRKFLTY